ncbi:hypothetical protein RJ640_026850 [Escallonia rubra]|uniref:Translation initiation factor 3 N-terminal domain-containing protein n=1 Tax=Escallonia rubra TaxID=112253 RepID=A0AA88RKN3_9ASTE|nr:hypothetical protein RJ640_026850 [Escallonia rubra]
MAFWCRIKKSHFKTFASDFKRCYFQIHAPSLLDHSAPHTSIQVLDKPNSVLHSNQFALPNPSHVRFFAAPVQYLKPKKEEKDTSGPRLNEQIRAWEVRLVTDGGHTIMSRNEALAQARKLDLDLVEVQRTADPPVCKIMDYHREKYKQQIKEKDKIKSKPETTLKKGPCKEVRFTFKIEQKDLQMKAEMAKRLMDKGYRVKVFSFYSLRDVPMVTVFLILCMAMHEPGKRNEKVDQKLGGLLSRCCALIEDVSVVESGPCVEPKQAYVIVRHAKFGPTKKGKASKISIPSPTANGLNQNHSELENSMDSGHCDSEAEDDVSPEEAPPSPSLEMPGDPEITKSTWSVFDGSDDFEKVFDFNGGAKSSSSQQNTFPEVMNKKPVLNSTAAHTGSPQMEAPLGNENRYKKNVGPNFPKQGRQPQFAPNSTRVPRGLNDHPIQSSPTDTNRYKKGANSNSPASKSDYR